MFGPSYEADDPVNSSISDALDAVFPHLHARDETLCSCRAPLFDAAARSVHRSVHLQKWSLRYGAESSASESSEHLNRFCFGHFRDHVCDEPNNSLVSFS
jgi:predicted dithiol-disulfide oxidoreductase (DUF899 family)